MRFALHLLAALLLIEEDAGCHEDGTADDERLADESRAVTGLGEVAGLGGIRAGEVLRGVCRLLLGGDITAGCCVPPSPVWANAVNGEMRLDPVMAAMVAAVTVRRAIPFGV